MAYDNLIKKIKYLLINSIFVACIYYGYVEHIEGAERVALFIAWLSIVVSFFALSDTFVETLRKNKPSFPKLVDRTFDLCVCAAFI